ncbi:creatininase family protein [Pseudohoeflea suaedae]|uniref:Creatininase family protein n=1 Tax=Pseudohoeflea suaedae TaxID=877384 RepID=A0A4R5PIB5_9HYPH|nr:creatininase family protein [Pseudohoeflea suaedae]TDH34976.1 creatininase family protein [Pseudohoeflea suaedae]
MANDKTDISRLNDSDMEAALARQPVLLLPIGAVESHGDHLPAGTDNTLAARLVEELVKAIGDDTPVLRLPVLPFGQVWSLAEAPGSFGVSNATVTNAIVEIAQSAAQKGIRTVVVVNAHLGNANAIRDAQRILREEGITLANFFYPGADAVIDEVREKRQAHGSYMHACEIETSYMLHLAPDAVEMDKAIANYPEFPEDFATVAYRWTDFSQSPVLGDARAATAEKGEKILSAVLANMAKQVALLYDRQSSSNS